MSVYCVSHLSPQVLLGIESLDDEEENLSPIFEDSPLDYVGFSSKVNQDLPKFRDNLQNFSANICEAKSKNDLAYLFHTYSSVLQMREEGRMISTRATEKLTRLFQSFVELINPMMSLINWRCWKKALEDHPDVLPACLIPQSLKVFHDRCRQSDQVDEEIAEIFNLLAEIVIQHGTLRQKFELYTIIFELQSQAKEEKLKDCLREKRLSIMSVLLKHIHEMKDYPTHLIILLEEIKKIKVILSIEKFYQYFASTFATLLDEQKSYFVPTIYSIVNDIYPVSSLRINRTTVKTKKTIIRLLNCLHQLYKDDSLKFRTLSCIGKVIYSDLHIDNPLAALLKGRLQFICDELKILDTKLKVRDQQFQKAVIQKISLMERGLLNQKTVIEYKGLAEIRSESKKIKDLATQFQKELSLFTEFVPDQSIDIIKKVAEYLLVYHSASFCPFVENLLLQGHHAGLFRGQVKLLTQSIKTKILSNICLSRWRVNQGQPLAQMRMLLTVELIENLFPVGSLGSKQAISHCSAISAALLMQSNQIVVSLFIAKDREAIHNQYADIIDCLVNYKVMEFQKKVRLDAILLMGRLIIYLPVILSFANKINKNLIRGDVRDPQALEKILKSHNECPQNFGYFEVDLVQSLVIYCPIERVEYFLQNIPERWQLMVDCMLRLIQCCSESTFFLPFTPYSETIWHFFQRFAAILLASEGCTELEHKSFLEKYNALAIGWEKRFQPRG